MALSRTVPWPLAVFAAAPADALPVIDYRLPPQPFDLRMEARSDCPSASSDDEIVVCGSRDEDSSYRVAYEPVPGARRRLIAGEPPGGAAALAAGGGGCSNVGPHVRCAGGLDVIGIAFTIARAVARLRDRD